MQLTNAKNYLSQQVDRENIRARFAEIFHRKGVMAAIANKAFRNLELKKERAGKESDDNGIYHYFLIGHLFKHIDTKAFFASVLNADETKQVPSRFRALQSFEFDFGPDFFTLLKSVRNVNSHYIHTFDCLRVDRLTPKLWKFIREAFELSSILSFINEYEMSAAAYFEDDMREEKLIAFWCDKFFPNTVYQSTVRKSFGNLTKSKAIDFLLTIDVDTPITWELSPGHQLFTIDSGRYLSFHATMVVISLSLYKNEANQLISKIKGFKRNDDNAYKSKRRIFTELSKRFSSQDNDHEQLHLVKFRDIIQYLNHYPTPWSEMLEPDKHPDAAARSLKESIVDMEIRRLYPEVFITGSNEEQERFAIYARYRLFGEVIKGRYKKSFISANFSSAESGKFEDVIYTSDEVKGLRRKLADLRNAQVIDGRRRKEIEKVKRALADAKSLPNQEVEKLANRLHSGLFFISYGRNQDRFMEFALRYLLEAAYFGPEAKACSYQFYTTEEQQDFLANAKNSSPKATYDKLKFHHGKSVHFITYADHLKKYPDWDTPFVVRNNAVQVEVPIDLEGPQGHPVYKVLTIQRAVMPYLLAHAMYHAERGTPAGQKLISAFYMRYHSQIEADMTFLSERTAITSIEKSRLKKRFPKRLLHNYHGGSNPQPYTTPLRALLEDANAQEERYALLLAEAKKKGIGAEFTKRNKGKQFKLRFLRRAWHELYFKKSYARQVALHDGQHHKSFHITRDEFNDFSRWMFAFDEVPQYKHQLEKLFSAKGFFHITSFRSLFDSGRSLEDFYYKTKQIFKTWLEEESKKSAVPKLRDLSAFKQQIDRPDLFINLSEFINFLIDTGTLSKDASGHIQYHCASNFPFLHSHFYEVSTLSGASATFRKRIGKHRLEDALLYEIAMHYLKMDTQVIQHARHHVGVIQQEDVELDLKDSKGNGLYKLSIPFHKISAFTELLTHKAKQEANPRFRNSSFLGNLKEYINLAQDEKEVKPICQVLARTGTLFYDDLHKINGHLVSQSIQFTQVVMALERYFISKGGVSLFNKDYIDFSKLPILMGYFENKKETRNKAFHFDVPKQTYRSLIFDIEKKFITNEVKPVGAKKWQDLPIEIRAILELFLNQLHEHFFGRKATDGVNRRRQAEDKYMNEVVN